MNFNLLYIAIFIFSLLIVGLILTVLEFKDIDDPKNKMKPNGPVGAYPEKLANDRAA